MADTPRDEAGFTLIELLVVVAIMPLILGAIAIALLAALHNQSGVAGRLSDSANAQGTSAFYVRDVQSAALVTTTASTSAPLPCGTGTTFALGLNWGGTSSSGTVVSYWQNPASGDIVRRFCAADSSTPLSTVTVARGLTGSGARVAVAPSSQAALAAAGWTPTAGISTVSLGALESTSTFRFDLVATPRLSTPETGNVSPGGHPPLLLLGSSPPLLSCTGNGRLIVNGDAFMDSVANPSGQLTGNVQFNATKIYTSDPATPAIVTTGNSGYSSAPTYSPTVPDPYAGLVPPSGGPVYTGPTFQGPGVYTNTVSYAGSNTVNLASGTYILQKGLTMTGNATLTSAAGGILLYISGGQVSLTGNVSVNLAPLSPAPYPTAPNLGIWQAQSDTNTLALTGNGSINTYQGTIYAPGAQVGGTGNSGFNAGSVIAAGLACTGNSDSTIG